MGRIATLYPVPTVYALCNLGSCYSKGTVLAHCPAVLSSTVNGIAASFSDYELDPVVMDREAFHDLVVQELSMG